MSTGTVQVSKIAKWVEKNPIVALVTLVATLIGGAASCIAIFVFVTGAASIGALNRPPHQGTFLKKGPRYKEMPTVRYAEAWTQPDMWPATGDKRPTIVFWQSTIDLQYLQLNEIVGGLGIQVGMTYYKGILHPMVNGFVGQSAAKAAGLRRGDVIVSINGVSTANMPAEQFPDYSTGPIGTPVYVVVQRNSKQLTFAFLRNPLKTGRRIPFSNVSDQKYLALVPTIDLSEGLYCFTAGSVVLPLNELPTWCFWVKR